VSRDQGKVERKHGGQRQQGHRIRQHRPFAVTSRLSGDRPVRRLVGVCWVSVRLFRALALGAAALILVACGGGLGRARAPPSVAWRVYRHLPGVVDLARARPPAP
jgi:hypothetical protein